MQFGTHKPARSYYAAPEGFRHESGIVPEIDQPGPDTAGTALPIPLELQGLWAKGWHCNDLRRQLHVGRQVARRMLTVFGGPHDPPQRSGELFRFTAGRAHSCEEKGAAVLEPDGRLVALGILHAACEARTPAPDCYAHFTMTLFVRDPVQRRPVIDDLAQWAKAEVDANTPDPDLAKPGLDWIEVIRIPG